MLELKMNIQSKVKVELDKQQKEYFLHQQMKTIQDELGGNPFEQEAEELKKKAAEKKWNKETADAFNKELEKFRRMNPSAAEYSVQVNYLQLMVDLPWNEFTKDNFELKKAQKILNEDHFGLDKVKERILEHLAILKLKGDLKAPILCLYGPPGVGKTTACKHVLRELEEETDAVATVYINCWKENTTFKVFIKLCEDLGYKFIQNKKTSELFQLIQQKLNKKAVVFIFDEIDKLEDLDFLYTLLEDIYRKSIFLITNYRDSYSELDERIRSRLAPEFLCFRSYSEAEISGILSERRNYAFSQQSWDEEAFKEIVEKSK